MSSLSDDENSANTELKINNEYAKNYNNWRQKEELHKLKQRYGEDACNLDNLSDESSDSSEDDDEVEVPEKFEEDFYKVLALLKSKDPRINDSSVSFFNEIEQKNEEDEGNRKKKSKKEKAVTLRDFERKIILERGGRYSDSEDESGPKIQNGNGLTYVQEQDEIKNSFKVALEDDEEEEDLLVVKDKSEEQIRKEETRKKWLKGQEVEIDPKDAVLKPIRDFWANPNLDADEKFLRDYILDKKYMEKNASDADLEYNQMVHDSDEDLSADEQNVEKQEIFEVKYNFRHEEPDPDFYKRFPRTLKNSMRKKDTRRSEKRAELKERKEKDKLRKKEELKELKALKRKEIEEKLEKLKEITGNDDIRINMADLEGDFDPNEHDRKMQEMFNDEYYTVLEDDMKPQFPEIDEELNAALPFNDYETINEGGDGNNEEPDCEDPNFIMDADYDASADVKSNKADFSKKKKRGRNKNIDLPKEKPKFDPEVHSTYQEFLDQYYALDYEDMIGDVPCRFKLRKSVPNDYGLTVEEILMADDKELNKWCSLKKALEFKPEEVERNELRRFQQKGKNEALKRKILKSFYSPEEDVENQEDTSTKEQTKKKKRKKKKGNTLKNDLKSVNFDAPLTSKNKQNVPESVDDVKKDSSSENVSLKSQKRKHADINSEENEKDSVQKKKKKSKNENSLNEIVNTTKGQEVPRKKKKNENQNKSLNDSKTEALNGLEDKREVNNENEGGQKKQKNKKKENRNKNFNVSESTKTLNRMGGKGEVINENVEVQKKNKNQKNNISNNDVKTEATGDETTKEKSDSEKYQKLMRKKENRRKKLEKKQKYLKLKNKLAKQDSKGNSLDELASLSADRLKAFGANPKKFKNRLKYGKKN